jgi:trehalose 6-phosphate synthase
VRAGRFGSDVVPRIDAIGAMVRVRRSSGGWTPRKPATSAESVPGPAGGPDLVLVSNRLPVRYSETSGRWVPAPGGLVSALRPVLDRHNGTWVGWKQSPRPLPRLASMVLHGVSLLSDTARAYYAGYANSVLWPALHGMDERIVDRHGCWDAYWTVNERFADEVARVAQPGANVWIQDYHLLLLPSLLAERRPDLGLGLFLHTPVADVRTIESLEHADELLAGIAGAALIGTQRSSDTEHLRSLLASHGHRHNTINTTQVRTHPISIDVERVVALAHDPTVRDEAARVRTHVAAQRRIVLSVDRMDYTKGILERLNAFDQLLKLGLVSVDDVVLIQIAVPSRTEVPAYRDLGARVQERVRAINQRHGSNNGPAVVLIFDDLAFRDVVAYYLAADTAMVTPRRDGMNLVAKEFATARAGDPVSLVLSFGAGAADELGAHATLVDAANPLDLAAGLRDALQLTPADRVARSTALGQIVAAHDVHAWADEFLADLHATTHPARARSSA